MWFKERLDEIRKFWRIPTSRGVVFLSLSVISMFIINYLNISPWTYAIPSSIISACVIGYFFQSYDIHDLYERSVLNAFISNDFLSKYNNDKLDSIMENAFRERYKISSILGPESLFVFVKDNIYNHIRSNFITNSEVKYMVWKEAKKQKVILNRKYTLNTHSNEIKSDTFPYRLIVKKVDGVDLDSCFKLNRLYINGNDQKNIDDIVKISEMDEGCYKINLFIPYSIKKNSPCIVDFEIETCEELSNDTYNQEFIFPTSDFKINVILFNYRKVNWDSYHSGIVPVDDKQVTKSESTFDIHYDKWMLPGHSYSIRFTEVE